VQSATYKQKTLHYIGVPLLIQYHVNEKNAIFAGASISYLINNKIRVDMAQPVFTSNAVLSSPLTNTRSGYYSSIDAALVAGYRRKLGVHFTIAPAFYYGLVDIKKDNYFNLYQFERNSGVKLVLSYTIFDF
ncbi:MAG TPA: outer membrane beta-barrel protein, partial [Bacteroidia bacterium]|nr:outer membrane beta-barrel protein [Bacteroidia bacterium]